MAQQAPSVSWATQVTAIILAAGFSTRMQRFKPLLPFGTGTVLSHAITLWQQVGLRSILVVCGHRADEVRLEATRYNATCVCNEHPERGMFSSVCTGLEAACSLFPQSHWFALLPVDLCLVQASTLHAVLTCSMHSQAEVIIPVSAHDHCPGHPPLLHHSIVPHLLAYTGDHGLHGAMASLTREEVLVQDPWLNTDIDYPQDYEYAVTILQKQHSV